MFFVLQFVVIICPTRTDYKLKIRQKNNFSRSRTTNNTHTRINIYIITDSINNKNNKKVIQSYVVSGCIGTRILQSAIIDQKNTAVERRSRAKFFSSVLFCFLSLSVSFYRVAQRDEEHRLQRLSFFVFPLSRSTRR